MNPSTPAILPCPFCGCPPIPHPKGFAVSCNTPGCAIEGHTENLKKWNRRAPAVQATADADWAAREIEKAVRRGVTEILTRSDVGVSVFLAAHGIHAPAKPENMEGAIQEAVELVMAEVSAIIRKAVSPKAAQEDGK